MNTSTTPVPLHGRGALLSAEDEIELAVRVEAGVLAGHALSVGARPAGANTAELALLAEKGAEAFQLLIERNLALVGMVVRQEATGRGASDPDVFQDGCLGLIEAVRRFDHRRGCRFATYALFWIRANVRASTALRGGQLNVPASRAERLRRARGVQSGLSQQLGREASAEEVGVALGRSADWVAQLLSHQREASLDEGAVEAQLADARAELELESILDATMPGEELLDQLEPGERRIISVRFGFDRDAVGQAVGSDARSGGGLAVLSYAATARRLGLSVRHVRCAEQRALETLRGSCPEQARVHLIR